MKLSELLGRRTLENLSIAFLKSAEKENLYNFSATKLNVVNPLKKVASRVSPVNEEDYLAWTVKDSKDYKREIANVKSIYIAGKQDWEIFNQEIIEENGIWVYRQGKLKLAITPPLFFKNSIIQEAKVWLTSDGQYLMNFIKKVDSNLEFDYFNKK